MKLITKIDPQEVDGFSQKLIAELMAQRTDFPLTDSIKAYFVDRIREDVGRAMNAAFDEGRKFERQNPPCTPQT